jgi:transposase
MARKRKPRRRLPKTKLDNLGRLTVGEFFARFPDEDACLTHIMEVRYGVRHLCRACKKEGTFHKLTERRAFSCAHCGNHVYPTAGTIFQDTRTPLQVWFYAIYLFVTTRHGVSGKELERALGVTYKTAWRMGQQIRSLMMKADGWQKLKGHVEADEALVGGRQSWADARELGSNKTVIMGIKERGGRLQAETIPDVTMGSLRKVIKRTVEPGSRVTTDERRGYNLLEGDGYKHYVVNHDQGEHVRGDDHTNHVESFWQLFKNSIRSTHIHVSRDYMNLYLGEFTFRSNHRQMANAMFDLLISAV